MATFKLQWFSRAVQPQQVHTSRNSRCGASQDLASEKKHGAEVLYQKLCVAKKRHNATILPATKL
jgi:hypothetical protein